MNRNFVRDQGINFLMVGCLYPTSIRRNGISGVRNGISGVSTFIRNLNELNYIRFTDSDTPLMLRSVMFRRSYPFSAYCSIIHINGKVEFNYDYLFGKCF